MKTQNKIRKSLFASFWDGIFASCTVGLTTDYITPYALALKAAPNQIGLLSALSSLSASLVQLKSADLTERLKSRTRLINTFVFLQVLVGIPIILIPYVFKNHPIIALIIFVSLFNSLQAFTAPSWSSLMSDYVPAKSRGRYFGWRSRVMTMVMIASSFAAGLILYRSKQDIFKGFLVIFSAAVLARFASWYFLTRMHDLPFRVREEHYFSFLDFVKRARESNFARFVFFVAGLTFCVNVASPFFSVFMLRDLKFNYLTYTVVVTTVSLTQIFTIGRWGRHADQVGNVKVLRFTSFFIASLPLWWIFNQHPAYLVWAQVLSGFAWAGFNLCATNFIYDAVTPQKRVRCIAYFNVFVGIATFSGALLGGCLVNLMPPLFGYRLLSLFLLSSALRFLVVSMFSPKIKEVRQTRQISSKDLFYSVVGLRPISGMNEE